MNVLVPAQKSRKDSGGSRRLELWVSQAQVRAWVRGSWGEWRGWVLRCRGGALNVRVVVGSYGKSLNRKSDR